MTVLFILSNIAIPFIVLSYASLVRVHQNGSFYSAKWFCLIVYTFISNFVFYFMSNNKIFLLIDLIFKLGIIFMPAIINQRIEKIISLFHLEIYINIVRSLIIKQFFILYTFITRVGMSWMTDEEQKLFKNAIVNSLQRKTPVPQTPTFAKQYKKFENRGVGCEIITMSMINDERMQKQLYKLQLSHSKVESNKSQLNHYGSTSNLKKEGLYSSKLQPLQQKVNAMKKKPTFTLQKSSTDIGLYDQEERMSFPKDQNEPRNIKTNSRTRSPEVKSSRISKKQEPSMILNKLDVSQYSDMFEDDEQAQRDAKRLIAKVETIIQISGVNSPRLQIYNIELYSNNWIRIISLYGRQFQRHRLVSMKPLKHGYYEMKVEGGKVDNRKVKFRGSFQPFLKYLQPEI